MVFLEGIRPNVIRNRFQDLNHDGEYVLHAWVRGQEHTGEWIDVTWPQQYTLRARCDLVEVPCPFCGKTGSERVYPGSRVPIYGCACGGEWRLNESVV